MSNASGWELTWTSACLVGIVVVLYVLRRALSDVWYLRRRGANGLNRPLAYWTVAVAISNTITLAVFAAVGINAMRYPSPPGGLTTFEIALTCGVFVVLGATLAVAIGGAYVYRLMDTHPIAPLLDLTEGGR